MAEERTRRPWRPEPGEKSALAYRWLVFLGPFLLLVASVALTGVGLWQESEPVATIGALGIVASLILPRMRGLFKLGPSGIEGEFRDGLIEEIVRQGTAKGLAPHDAEEVAEEAAVELSFEGPFRVPEATARSAVEGIIERRVLTRLRSRYAAAVVESAVSHERAVLEVARRVAERRGWRIAEQAPEFGAYGRVDLAIETAEGLVLIEANHLVSHGGAGFVMLRWALATTKQELRARAAFIVLPDRAVLASGELEGVELVKLSELADALLAL